MRPLYWFEILPVIHLTMAKADLDHPALEKVPFYEARLIHRKDIHTASVHSTGQLYIPFQVVLPQLSVSLLPHIAQFCFQQLSVTFSVHSTFYHFEPAVSSLYKTIAIVISYRIFNSIQIVFQTFSKTS